MLLQSILCLCLTVLYSFHLNAETENQNKSTEKSLNISEQNISKQESEVASFTPPSGWRLADTKVLPPSVKIMVVGKGEHEFPPSINLGTEKFDGTLEEYLKVIKKINDSQGAAWKDLGMIRTEAGDASLSQLDTKTEWGNIRMMHVILVRNGIVYILTAAALQEEFPKFYKDFFSSMKTLHFNS